MLGLYLEHFGIRPREHPRDLLERVAAAFAAIPYENLTKILKHDAEGSPERSRRWPLEVVSEHVALGAGGTCFSLTAALLHILRALGWRAEPILADRHYGPDTHCALLVWIDGRPHLLDPGFLLVQPVPLGEAAGRSFQTAFNEVVLSPVDGGARLELSTIQQGVERRRLTFKTSPADPGEFLRAWDASFGWDMMRYPLLSRVSGESQAYLQETRLQVRSRAAVARSEVPPEDLPAAVAGRFGIDQGLAARALEVLRRRGELEWAR